MRSKRHEQLAEYWVDYPCQVLLNKKDLIQRIMRKQKQDLKREIYYEW